ncbi:uncharacterized protein Z518_04333 [Rhinocladiella mackenziei CBS 650.93]|uniref:Nicotinamide riboside kinase n=1 Tax=Rhinocladiella mackenziei CBS 650.93 TaxID=1442369 RepID=A0A0D2FW23_9EURO|nr:uncharacterized protein Z518_04333 [Rhinocladiella mackenziei CBS 650.93]KIX06357.1 hypothetical protein Z518_04333 [Rhinocladiella mackenziei CBS 650.93]
MSAPSETQRQKNAKLDAENPSTASSPWTILIGISGPSCSGKTTLARLLKAIFNFSITVPSGEGGADEEWKLSLFVLHQDDFYKTDKDVPVITVTSPEYGTRDLQDWDCVESLDLPLLEKTLRYVRARGSLPPDMVSKEDQNAVGASWVSDDEVQVMKQELEAWFENFVKDNVGWRETTKREIRICILDGFLLYPPAPVSRMEEHSESLQPPSRPSRQPRERDSHYPHPSSPKALDNPSSSNHSDSVAYLYSSSPELNHLYTLSHNLLHPRLFLSSTREQTLARRIARTGYVTLESFWTDPPGYVEDVVWPNYARDHAWMYKRGDVESGVFDEDRCLQEGVMLFPGRGSWEMKACLAWAVDRVRDAVREKVSSELIVIDGDFGFHFDLDFGFDLNGNMDSGHE